MPTEKTTYKDLLVLAFGQERYDDAMARDYNIRTPRQHYACRDGKCVMAVMARTEDPFPCAYDTIDDVIASNENYPVFVDIAGFIGNLIDANDRGLLVDQPLREEIMNRPVVMMRETMDFLRERAREREAQASAPALA